MKFRHKISGKWVEVTESEHRSHMASLLQPQRGLGDAVAKVAQPIAKFIDRIAGTNIQNCGGCAQRQAALNRILPDL